MAHRNHVLILVENLSVPFDRRVWMEATTLQEAGYQVHVVCPKSDRHPESRESLQGVNIYRYPQGIEGRSALGTLAEYGWALLCMTWLVLKVSLRFPVKIVQVCNPPDILFLATWPARLVRSSKMIFDQHDVCPELWEAKGNSKDNLYGKALLKAEQLTYRLADVVISTNESYKEIAITRGKKDPNNVFVVRSAPRRDFAIESIPTTRSPEQARRLAYIGTMGAQEGIDILLESTKLLVDEYGLGDLHLDLIGDGPELAYLKALASELQLGPNITFHGRVSDEKLREIIAQADIGVNPDRPSQMNNISSMNKIVEYMALGLPIVQFDCIEGKRTAGDASEYVMQTNPNAFAESIFKLLTDEQRRTKMKTFGHSRFLNSLAWETQTHSLSRAYIEASK